MLRDDLCYLSGLIDGEGSITLEITHGWAPRLAISQKFPAIIRWLHQTFGGSMYQSRDKERPQRWNWVVSGRQAVNVLAMALPWLVEKKPQAELLFDAQRQTTQRHGRRVSLEEKALRCGYKLALQEAKRHATV